MGLVQREKTKSRNDIRVFDGQLKPGFGKGLGKSNLTIMVNVLPGLAYYYFDHGKSERAWAKVTLLSW